MHDKRFIPIEAHWSNFVNRFQTITEAADQLLTDMEDMNCDSDQALKLIQLASCQSSPNSDRFNACRDAFIILVDHANKMVASA